MICTQTKTTQIMTLWMKWPSTIRISISQQPPNKLATDNNDWIKYALINGHTCWIYYWSYSGLEVTDRTRFQKNDKGTKITVPKCKEPCLQLSSSGHYKQWSIDKNPIQQQLQLQQYKNCHSKDPIAHALLQRLTRSQRRSAKAATATAIQKTLQHQAAKQTSLQVAAIALQKRRNTNAWLQTLHLRTT